MAKRFTYLIKMLGSEDTFTSPEFVSLYEAEGFRNRLNGTDLVRIDDILGDMWINPRYILTVERKFS